MTSHNRPILSMRIVSLVLLSSAAVGCDDGYRAQQSKAVSDTVGAEGKTVSSGDASVVVPAGAVSAPVKLTVEPVANQSLKAKLATGDAFAGTAIALMPHAMTFEKAVTISIPADADANGVLRLDDENDTTWEEVASPRFADGKATFESNHFCIYAAIKRHPPTEGTGGAGGAVGSGGKGGAGGLTDVQGSGGKPGSGGAIGSGGSVGGTGGKVGSGGAIGSGGAVEGTGGKVGSGGATGSGGSGGLSVLPECASCLDTSCNAKWAACNANTPCGYFALCYFSGRGTYYANCTSDVGENTQMANIRSCASISCTTPCKVPAAATMLGSSWAKTSS